MPKRIVDPIFGALEFEYLWRGKAACKRLGPDVLLLVDTDGDPPSESQRQAYQSFLADENRMVALIENAIFDYYNEVKNIYREQADPKAAAERVPELYHPSDVWQLLRPPTLVIPPQEGEEWQLAVAFTGTWDEEHSFKVILRGKRVVGVEENT